MNFLAHLFLSCDNDDLMIGNMIADFIRNREVKNYSKEVQKGIKLHRQIDHFTDHHPIVRLGAHRLQANHGKYAPVVIDIFYDHLLAKNWERYDDESLNAFTKRAYRVLTDRKAEIPPKLSKQLPDMIERNWLEQYKSEAGMQYVFELMDLRTSFPSNFSSAMDDLLGDYKQFEDEFNQFFPEVIEFVKNSYKEMNLEED